MTVGCLGVEGLEGLNWVTHNNVWWRVGLKVQIDWHIIIYYCHYHITILMSLWALSVCHPLFMLQPLCEILIGPVMCGQQIFLMTGRVKSHKWPRKNFSLKCQNNIKEPSDENKENINYLSINFVNPSTPMSDQDRISLYNNIVILSIQ